MDHTVKEDVIAELRAIPSLSLKCAEGLYLIGINSIGDLKGKDPDELYARLKSRKDFFAEPCMFNMIRIAVGFANKRVL